MLAITDTRNSDGVPGLSTDFLVASIELLDDSSLRIWFTRPVLNGSITANYSVSGSSVKNVILAQYETDIRGVRIYLDAPLSIGQWVIQFRSGPPGTLISNDSDHFILPSNTQVVIDLVDKSSQDSVGTNLVESPVGQFIPKEFRSKKVYSAIVAGIEAGDKIVSDQARLAFDQYFVSTASDKYLTTRAADRGIQKPEKLGIADADFRNLVIDVSNNKLTNDALLSVLEIMYGPDSVRGYVETAIVEPFEIFDGAYLDFLIDGKTKFRFTANWVDYQTPLRATGVELSSALNFAFDKNGINAYATVENSKVRVYSNTKGIQSSVSIQGGTLQPYVEFDSPVYGAFSPTQQQSLEWILINPSVGIVRFIQTTIVNDFRAPTLKIGDYVTIVGSNFPVELRGSWPILDVQFWYAPTPIQWFDIASDYIVP